MSRRDKRDGVARGLHGVLFLMGIVKRRSENGHQAVADKLVERTFAAVNDVDHPREVLVQLFQHILGAHVLGNSRKAANVAAARKPNFGYNHMEEKSLDLTTAQIHTRDVVTSKSPIA